MSSWWCWWGHTSSGICHADQIASKSARTLKMEAVSCYKPSVTIFTNGHCDICRKIVILSATMVLPTWYTNHTLNAIVAQLKNFVFEKLSKRKFTYEYTLILIFWKYFEGNAFNCILLFVYSWHLYGLLAFNNSLLRF